MASGQYRPKTQWLLVGAIVVVTTLTTLGAIYYPWGLGPRQPIPFRHRIHAGTREIGCLLCRPGALHRSVAGMPSEQTCLLCHSRIIVHHPQIERLRRSDRRGEPIAWVRVSNLPDLAHLDHSMHLAAGVDCGRCHGNVKGMDRFVLHQDFNMGYCIQCHRENNATHDCFACHY
ncbi:MAG: cytochrome c family protein [Planctomycetes bacterium]|jgi:hypothetical protein|nr:cytochrome c family protein [Planctomycetota bacterium]